MSMSIWVCCCCCLPGGHFMDFAQPHAFKSEKCRLLVLRPEQRPRRRPSSKMANESLLLVFSIGSSHFACPVGFLGLLTQRKRALSGRRWPCGALDGPPRTQTSNPNSLMMDMQNAVNFICNVVCNHWRPTQSQVMIIIKKQLLPRAETGRERERKQMKKKQRKRLSRF